MVKRGDIWLVLEIAAAGSEIKKTRPWLIVSPPEIHDTSRTLIAVPLSTTTRSRPFRVPITFQSKRGLVLLDQLRALDKSRLIRRLGKSPQQTLALTLARLQAMFAE